MADLGGGEVAATGDFGQRVTGFGDPSPAARRPRPVARRPLPATRCPNLLAHDVALQAITELNPLVGRIRRHDRSLAQQLTRAASSIVLNIAEAEYSDPGNRRARLFTAAGSANESRAALRVAIAWGYVGEPAARQSLASLDRVVGMLWGLTHGRK